MRTKLSHKQMFKLLNRVNQPGERVVAICVPTRVFRVVALEDECRFRVEQLDRQAGDKWQPIALCHELLPWRAYQEALTKAIACNNEFLTEMRKVKAQQRMMYRAEQAGALDVYTK